MSEKDQEAEPDEETEQTDQEPASSKSTDDNSDCKGPEYCPAKVGIKDGVVCRRRPEGMYEWLASIFTTNRYYWEILKSTVMFLIALKVARECMMLKIPMREYKPFNRCIL